MDTMKTSHDQTRTGGEHAPLKTLADEKTGALHPRDSVETAGQVMREHDAAAWPVAEDRKLIGMVHEKNPDAEIGGHGHDPKSWTVSQIMSRDVVFCYEDEDCAHAEQVMDENGLRYLPIVDHEQRLIGMFTREEIHEKAAPQQPQAVP